MWKLYACAEPAASAATDKARSVFFHNGDYGSNKVKFGAYYGGSSKRNIKNVDLKNNRKNTWGTGLIFNHEIDSIQNVTVAAGFTRQISENANKTAYYSNAYALG